MWRQTVARQAQTQFAPLPRPPKMRGYELGNRSGYKAPSMVISGVIKGLSRYKFDQQNPNLYLLRSLINPLITRRRALQPDV